MEGQILFCNSQSAELPNTKEALSVPELITKLMQAGKPNNVIKLLALGGVTFQSENLDVFKAAWHSSLHLDNWDVVCQSKVSDHSYREALRGTNLYESAITCYSYPCVLSQEEVLGSLQGERGLPQECLRAASDAVQLGATEAAS